MTSTNYEKWGQYFILGVAAALEIGTFCLALGIPVWQVYRWLRVGEWIPFSGLDALSHVFEWLHVSRDWLIAPKDWVGLHAALDWVHGSVLLWLFGLIVYLVLIFDLDDDVK